MSGDKLDQKSDLSVTHGEQLGKEVTPSYSEMLGMEKSPEHIRAIEMVSQFEAGLIKATDLQRAFPETYRNWDGMKQRCRKNDVALAPEFERFFNFLRLAGPRPEKSWSIDRICPSGPYSPENCRWASKKVQARNRTNTVTMTAQGIKRPLVEWAEINGENPELYRTRKREGWSDEEIISGERKNAASQPVAGSSLPNLFRLTPWVRGHEYYLEKLYRRYREEGEGRLHFMGRYARKRIKAISEIADLYTWPPEYDAPNNEVAVAENYAKEMDFFRTVLADFNKRKNRNPHALHRDRPLSPKLEGQLQAIVAAYEKS